MPHTRTHRRSPAAVALILMLATIGLVACGGSSNTSTSTQTTTDPAAANAGAPANTTANTTATGTSTTGTSTSSSATTTTRTSPAGTSTAGTSTTGATSARAKSARVSAVRACLAKKGITLPLNGPLSGAKLPKGMTQAQFAQALQTCAESLAGNGLRAPGKGIHSPFSNPRFRAVLLRFAACLRQNGINVGEPNTSGKGSVFDTKGINTGSPKFKAAALKCRSTLVHGFKAHPGASPAH